MTERPPVALPHFAPGDVLPGRVLALDDDGDARGTLEDGRPVRVRGGVPGDVGGLRIVHRGKNVTWVELADLTSPSPERVAPPCPVVLQCGGCPWQMVSDGAQRAARLDLLREALGAALDGATVHATVTAAAPVGYRTRALMMARHVGGALRLGFYAPRSNALVPAEGCVVQHPQVNAALEAARALLATSTLTTSAGPGQPGTLRAVAFKLDPASGQGLLTLVASRDHARFDALGAALLALPGVAGVHLCVNDAPSGQLLRGPTRRLAGASRLTLHLGPVTVQVGPAAFVQTHHAMAAQMVAAVLALAPARAAHVVDLYAGVGVFGLALRDRADAVTLVEASPDAVRDARANASRLPGAEHVEVVEGDAAEQAARVVKGGPDELVVLDPPRSGCAPEVLAALAAARPATVLYVSCSPRSLARDLGTLAEAGYRLADLVPFEMFPHTPHLEVVARLCLRA